MPRDDRLSIVGDVRTSFLRMRSTTLNCLWNWDRDDFGRSRSISAKVFGIPRSLLAAKSAERSNMVGRSFVFESPACSTLAHIRSAASTTESGISIVRASRSSMVLVDSVVRWRRRASSAGGSWTSMQSSISTMVLEGVSKRSEISDAGLLNGLGSDGVVTGGDVKEDSESRILHGDFGEETSGSKGEDSTTLSFSFWRKYSTQPFSPDKLPKEAAASHPSGHSSLL